MDSTARPARIRGCRSPLRCRLLRRRQTVPQRERQEPSTACCLVVVVGGKTRRTGSKQVVRCRGWFWGGPGVCFFWCLPRSVPLGVQGGRQDNGARDSAVQPCVSPGMFLMVKRMELEISSWKFGGILNGTESLCLVADSLDRKTINRLLLREGISGRNHECFTRTLWYGCSTFAGQFLEASYAEMRNTLVDSTAPSNPR